MDLKASYILDKDNMFSENAANANIPNVIGENEPSKRKRGEGVTTLINMGNTCFMNSALQCLMHTKPLVDFFHKYTIVQCEFCKNDLNLLKCNELRIPGSVNIMCPNCRNTIDLHDNPLENVNPKNESLAIIFVKSVRSLCVGYWEENCRVQPETFYKVFSACLQKIFNTEVFRLGDQQDSQECLVYILDLLHMGLSRQVNIQMDNNEAPHVAWMNHLKKNGHSFLIDSMYGLTRTCVECQDCKSISKRFDPVSSISLSFPPNLKGVQSVTLEDMFRFYSYPEMLNGDNKYDCEKCKANFKKHQDSQLSQTPATTATTTSLQQTPVEQVLQTPISTTQPQTPIECVLPQIAPILQESLVSQPPQDGTNVNTIQNIILQPQLQLQPVVQKYQLSEAKKKIEAWMFPSTLVLDFKRYKVEMIKFPNGQFGMRRNKINTLVKCPLEIDLGQFLPHQIVKNSVNNTYELYAAIYHSGVLQGGHYVAACKLDGRGWVKFDDARFEDLTDDTVVNSLIYVAFYRRKY